MIVAKFGGTSMATAAQIKKACDIMLADNNRRIMVVSAPGKRCSGDTKITDLLIELAETALNGRDFSAGLKSVADRYALIAEELGLDGGIIKQIENDIRQRLSRTSLSRERFLDLLKAAGEDNCAKLVASYLTYIGVNARYVNPGEVGMLLSDQPGNAYVLPQAYALLHALTKKQGIIVFPGFFGVTTNGEVTTFSRGGSDLTGAILAAAVNASVYENYTDVDSVYAADPRVAENPPPIKEITYQEMRELAYAGFNIFHEEAVEPVVRARIPIHIKNTNNPSSEGTKIVFARKCGSAADRGPVAIAGSGGFCNLSVSKYLMNREIGFGRKLFQVLEEEKISFDHAPSGIDNISPILRQNQLNAEKMRILESRIKDELNADSVQIARDIALVVIVCENVCATRQASVKALKALSQSGIETVVLIMGANSISLTIGVAERDLNKAVKAVYDRFFGFSASQD